MNLINLENNYIYTYISDVWQMQKKGGGEKKRTRIEIYVQIVFNRFIYKTI